MLLITNGYSTASYRENIWGSVIINDRGQLVIPKAVRELFGLTGGQRLIVLSDEQLLDYLSLIEQKTYDYLDSLTDDMLYECPENCEHTRMELVLRQFRHISFHTGMLNGQTAVATGKFPMWVSQADKYVDDGILFGRYRKGQVTK